jgi:hypothetical protein
MVNHDIPPIRRGALDRPGGGEIRAAMTLEAFDETGVPES